MKSNAGRQRALDPLSLKRLEFAPPSPTTNPPPPPIVNFFSISLSLSLFVLTLERERKRRVITREYEARTEIERERERSSRLGRDPCGAATNVVTRKHCERPTSGQERRGRNCKLRESLANRGSPRLVRGF